MGLFHFNFLGQGTLSPVNPLAYGMKICVRAYGASALQFLYIYAVGFVNLNAVDGVLQGVTPVLRHKCVFSILFFITSLFTTKTSHFVNSIHHIRYIIRRNNIRFTNESFYLIRKKEY
jgi:hypothetical protein